MSFKQLLDAAAVSLGGTTPNLNVRIPLAGESAADCNRPLNRLIQLLTPIGGGEVGPDDGGDLMICVRADVFKIGDTEIIYAGVTGEPITDDQSISPATIWAIWILASPLMQLQPLFGNQL